MKNENKTRFVLFLTAFVVVSFFSISAYTGAFNKGVKNNYPPYKPPIGKIDVGPIHITTSLDNSYYFDNNNVYLFIDLKADKVGNERDRSPLNIAVVIDRSGSMADKNKLGYVKKAVDYIIDQTGGDDYISVVTYDDYVDVLQRSAVVRDKSDLRKRVSRLEPGGFTNLSEGMFEGYDQVNNTYSRGYVNRVLLLSDGLANRGITDRFRLADMVRDKNRRDGITISTFGVGNDFNENLMTDIADYGRGNYYYIRNSYDIPEIFANELSGVRNLVGQGTRMKVRFPSEYLSLNKVFGYPYDISGDEITIDFKDVFSDQTKSVLIKFNVNKRIDRKLSFTSELTYEDVNSNFDRVTSKEDNSLEPAKNKDEYTKGSNETVAQNISVFEANDLMESALREADNGNYDNARNILKDAQGYMNEQMNTVTASPEMKRQSENMDKYNDELKSAEKKTDEEKSEMQKSGKFDNYNSRKNNH
jgi:Ca-activated chloride channel homolog